MRKKSANTVVAVSATTPEIAMPRRTNNRMADKIAAMTDEQREEALDLFIQRFSKAKEAGNAALQNMGAQLVAAISVCGRGTAMAAFKKAFPDIRPATWKMLELVGEGKVLPEIFMVSLSPAFINRLARTPTEFQQKLINEGVEVASHRGAKTKTVLWSSITEKDVSTLVTPDGTVRDMAAQKEHLASLRRSKTEQLTKMAEYKRNADGSITVTKLGRITKAKLKELAK